MAYGWAAAGSGVRKREQRPARALDSHKPVLFAATVDRQPTAGNTRPKPYTHLAHAQQRDRGAVPELRPEGRPRARAALVLAVPPRPGRRHVQQHLFTRRRLHQPADHVVRGRVRIRLCHLLFAARIAPASPVAVRGRARGPATIEPELEPRLSGVGSARDVADGLAIPAGGESHVKQPVIAKAPGEIRTECPHRRGEEELDALVRTNPLV